MAYPYRNLRSLSFLAALALTAAPALLVADDAEACGGTFCDGGNQNMPVDQTGENILFVLAEDYTEAHIQIQYDPDTDAEKFGWIVPMLEVPEFSVGSQQLFINLLNATVPLYGFSTQFETCGGGSGGWDDPCTGGGTSGATADPGDGEGTGDWDEPPGPDILLRTTVGAFDVVVLQGENAGIIMDWLGEHGYFQDPASEPILEEYIADGYVFAAFKLVQGAGVDEIHPVTLRYNHNEPCVPIKLTRIAAQPDMDIRTFFLSTQRVAPSNYHNVVLNEAQLNWPIFADNYKEVVSLAVDEAPANGHAFVTEYAGSSAIVSDIGLYSALWDHTPFIDLKPIGVIERLQEQGLIECFGQECLYNHPLLQGILYQFLPVPDGIEEGAFYSCLECYEGLIDEGAYIPELFAEALRERIIEPGFHASELLESWPYLTRLYTTLSPEEMTVDPFFHQNADLPVVDGVTRMATQTVACSGTSQWDLPSGFSVASNGGWPTMPEEMPWSQRIELIPMVGPPQVAVDNTQLITMLLAMLRAALPTIPRDCHEPPGGETETSSGGETAGETGDTDTGATGGLDDANDGCGCRSGGGDPWLAGFGVLAVGGLLGRRRRR